MRLDTFTKNSIIMFLAFNLGSCFNFMYQLVMLRSISRESFASLNSLLSLLVILLVPAVAFTTLVTKHVSSAHAREEGEDLKAIWRKLSGHAAGCSLVIFLMMVVCSSSLTKFLHLSSPRYVIILGCIFFLSGVTAVLYGGLQGLEKFKWLALCSLSVGLSKLLFSLGLIHAVPQLDGALLGFLFSLCIGAALSIYPLRSLFGKNKGAKISLKKLYVYIIPVSVVSLCMALLTNLDMVLVKHFFRDQAQDYSVAQIIGKMALFLPGMIYVVMFPRVSSLYAMKKNPTEILKRSIVYTMGLSLCVVAVFNLFPSFMLTALSRSVNAHTVTLARLFSISMLFMAASNVLFYYQLSIERYGFIVPLLIITLLLFFCIWFFHFSCIWIISAMLAGAVLIFSLNLRSSLKESFALGRMPQ